MLRDIFETRREKTMFLVGAPTLPYGEIVAVIDAAKGAGLEKVGIVTEGMRRRPASRRAGTDPLSGTNTARPAASPLDGVTPLCLRASRCQRDGGVARSNLRPAPPPARALPPRGPAGAGPASEASTAPPRIRADHRQRPPDRDLPVHVVSSSVSIFVPTNVEHERQARLQVGGSGP